MRGGLVLLAALAALAGLGAAVPPPGVDLARVLSDAPAPRLSDYRLFVDAGANRPNARVVPYDLASMRRQWPTGVAHGTVVRFSVGLEAVEDLQADLAQALARSGLA